MVRFAQLERVPDLVVWPGCHENVEAIVALANELNVVVIPFGGGTSVSGALTCPSNETRMIVSLDMHEMNKIKWIDNENMLVCMEAGIVGQDLKRRLEAQGLTIGHEPDSLEFSSLGGWIATRASGMKKNTYGNIEDMLVRVKLVTAVGTVDRSVEVPRLSMGPDVQQLVLGPEGTLGVITEAVLCGSGCAAAHARGRAYRCGGRGRYTVTLTPAQPSRALNLRSCVYQRGGLEAQFFARRNEALQANDGAEVGGARRGLGAAQRAVSGR
jgi:hypothetical protein